MKLTDRIVSCFDRTNDIFAYLAGAILAFIVLSVSVEVVFRYFLNAPSDWVVEVNENCLLYMTFLAVGWVLSRDRHVKVELVTSRVSTKTQHLFALITSVLGLIVCLIVTWYGIRVTWLDFQSGAFRPGINKIPEASVLFIIPVGTFLLSFQFLRRIFNFSKKFRES
jgi:C4-dicarboxylate transporter DctQ subunit